ncbi:hypothetical protein [Erwinia psidii]|uniref:hypothetical protein n=1 Tax=Erwinia psidii TaxID=69224 RepID=UPI0018F5B1A2|nr:hypothetical protein [Erwinia psidii]
MREISHLYFSVISGANANSNYEGIGGNNGRTKSSNKTGRSGGGYYASLGEDVNACNDGIIGGMVAGSPGGFWGLAAGLVGGAIAGGCFRDHGDGNGGGSGSDTNCSDNSCSW